MTDFALFTLVMKVAHLPVLDDWLTFLGERPASLDLILGDEPGLGGHVDALASKFGLPVNVVETCSASSVRDGETRYLKQQFAACSARYALVIRLDTLPFRKGNADWFSHDLALLVRDQYVCLTGSTRPYRADVTLPGEAHARTQRISNNFLLIETARWLDIQERMAPREAEFGRFATEGLMEVYLRDTGMFGLRRINRPDWAVVHTQLWDDRQAAARVALRDDAAALKPFLRGFEDDLNYDWERYFMYPKPPLLRRMRTTVGAWRRSLRGGRT